MKILNSIKNKCGGMAVVYVFISFILGFLGMGGVYYLLHNKNQVFTDIVLEYMGIEDGNKSADIYSWITFFIIYTVSYLLLSRVKGEQKHVEEKHEWGILGICLFFILWGIRNYGVDRVKTSIVIVIFGMICYLYKNKVSARRIFEILVSIYCIYLSLSGIAALVDYLVGGSRVLYQYSGYWTSLSMIVLAMGYIWANIKGTVNRYIQGWIIQIAIPLNLLSIIGVDYWYHGEQIAVSDYKKFTIIVICLCSLFIIYGTVQYAKKAKANNNLYLTLPTILSFGIINWWNTGYNLIINQDPYHIGETAIVWKQIVEMGQKWGDEFISVMQGMGFITSAINQLFFEGNIATYVQTGYTLIVIAGIITISALYKIVDHKALLFILVPLLPFFIFDRLYLIAWVYFFLLNPNYIKNPVKWTYCYIFTCIIHVFYQPTYGGAVAFSLLPILVYLWYVEHKNNKIFNLKLRSNRKKLLLLLGSCSLIGILCIPMLVHAVRFLSDNGYETQNANGILFSRSFDFGTIALTNNAMVDMVLFIFAKFGTGLLTFALMVYFFMTYVIADKNTVRRVQGGILTVSAAISYLLLTPAVFTRIDGGLSRVGMFSSVYFCGFIPILFYLYRDELRFKKIAVFLLGVIGCVCIYIQIPDYFIVHKKAVERVEIPQEAMHVNEEYSGLSNWGDVFLTDSNYLHEAMAINEMCTYLLKDGQTYLDVTDKQVYYNFTDRKVPGIYASTYNLYNDPLQEKEIEKLKKEDYPIIFIHNLRMPMTSLRSYRVYRHYMLQDYNYVVYKGVQFMVRDDVILTPISDKIEYIEYCQDSIQSINNVFHVPEIKYLAAEWGSSWENMQERFTQAYSSAEEQQKYTVDDSDCRITFKIEDSISGRKAEFIRLSLNYSNNGEKNAYAIVKGKTGKGQGFEESFHFVAKEANNQTQSALLIPIASSPQCLKADEIDEITLVFETDREPYQVVINEMELYYLSD